MWLTLLAPLIPQLVTTVEKLFGAKTGDTKLDTVLKALQPILNALLTSGKIAGPGPATSDIITEINKVVTALFPNGVTTPTGGTASGPLDITALLASNPQLKQTVRDIISWSLQP